MLNAAQAWILRNAVREKEEHEALAKAKSEILVMFNGGTKSLDDEAYAGVDIEYDEFGAPRPRIRAYDGGDSDAHDLRAPVQRRVQPLPPETVPTDDEANPFPGLDPPVG